MILDSGTVFRSIAAQNIFSFDLSVINSNTSGIFNFGLSGESGAFHLFKFESGKIYDFNGRYIWGYTPRENINIYGNVGSGYINYFINEVPVCLFSPHVSKYYNNFYGQTKNTLVELDFVLNGTLPKYDIIFPNTVVNGENFTGFLNNNSEIDKTFRIFTGDITNINTSFNFESFEKKNISGGNSGSLFFSSTFNPLLLENNNGQFILNLETNFGNISKTIDLIINPESVYLIDFITGFTGIIGFEKDRSLSKIYNYELRTIAQKDLFIGISLESVSGHNSELIYADYGVTGEGEGNLSNFIHGFDYISGYTTGIATSSLKNYYGNQIKSSFNILEKRRQNATGFIDYHYRLPLFGGSGLGPAPLGTIITGSGIVNTSIDFLSPIFILNSGLYPVNVVFTGIYNNYTNVITKLEHVPLYFTGTILLNYLDYFWSGNVTGENFTGISNKIYGITGNEEFIISGDPFNSNTLGFINYNNYVLSSQPTETFHLRPIINQNTGLFINSGSGIASENIQNFSSAFTGENYYYLNNNVGTGFIGIFFSGYNLENKPPINFYEFNLDFNSQLYPYIFNFEYSLDGLNWFIGDSQTGVNFYKNKDFYVSKLENQITNYNYIRLNIISGRLWDHLNDSQNNNKIGIKKFETYNSLPVSLYLSGSNEQGLVPELNDYNNNLFWSDENIDRPAWHAFNSNKSLYPYAEILPNDGVLDLGWASYGGEVEDKFFTSFFIEFEPTGKPDRFSIFARFPNLNFESIEIYRKDYNIQNVESGILNNYIGIDEIKFVFYKNELLSSSSSSSSLSSSSSSSSSSEIIFELGFNSALWVDPSEDNIIY
jgi:hypothetical protein